MPSDRRYCIANSPHRFWAGITQNRQQVLMGIGSAGSIVGLFFDGSGSLSGQETRRLPDHPTTGGLDPQEPAFVEKVENCVRQWQSELGFVPGTISVRRFCEAGAEIEDLPWHLRDFRDDPERFADDPEERELLQRELEKWISNGMFLLRWSGDYWMNRDGTIHST